MLLNKLKIVEKYLSKLSQRIKYIKSYVKQSLINFHYYCKDNGLYKGVVRESGTIVLNGFFIWLMLIPFWDGNLFWFIPCYGVFPWFIVAFIQEIRK